jgi:hypothetical protein
MSDSPPEPPAEPQEKRPPARPVNRWGVGTLSVIQIVLLVAILIALNYLGELHYFRKDFSREGAYTLSPSTQRYLKSDAVKNHATPIKWVLAFRRSSPFYERVRALAEDYTRLSGGKIQIEILDPLRSPDRTQQVAAAYGISLVRDLLIMDARMDASAVTTQDNTGTRTLNPNVKLVVADEMVVYSTENGQRRATGFKGEDVLTARLVEAIEGRPRKMLFLSDKSRIDAEGENSPWKSLEETLRFQNIQLSAATLSGLAEIPEDAEGVALVAPKYDLTDAEIAVLDRYWQRNRSALLILLQPGETPPKLRAFLRSNGVTPRRDRIVSREGDVLNTTARGLYTYGVDFLKELAGQAAVFEGASSSLEVREGAEDLMTRKISPFGLIQISDGFWGETKFGDGKETFNAQEDFKAPLFLAASVTRGATSDDRFAADTSRMMIMANTDFLDPSRQRAENIDFLASSVNWLVGRDSLSGIGPRSLVTYKLPILDAQVSFINRVNLFFLPGLFLLLGAFVWSSRRA